MTGDAGNVPEPLELLHEGFARRILEASALLRAHRGPIRVVTHYDGDGIAAGAVLFALLQRMGRRMHLSFIKGLNERTAEEHLRWTAGTGGGEGGREAGGPGRVDGGGGTLYIFADMGVNRLDLISSLDGGAIVLDHHIGEGGADGVLVLNCRDWGVNGSDEASGSTMAFLLAAATDQRNWDMFDMAMVGMMADRQHLGGLKGLNAQLALAAESKGVIRSRRRLRLMDLPLEESLRETWEPMFPRFFAGEVPPGRFLADLGLDPMMRLRDMDESQTQRLGSALAVELLRCGVRPEFAEDVLVRGYTSRRYPTFIEEVSHVVNSCGRMGEMGVGMAACLGGGDHLVRGTALRNQYRVRIKRGLEAIIAGGYTEADHITHFQSDSDEYAGALAGLSMMYLLNPEKPIISYALVGDQYKISGRGTRYLVEKRGLDLARVLDAAAFAVDGRGGGHPVASGASIPRDRLAEFLEDVNLKVGAQLETVEEDVL